MEFNIENLNMINNRLTNGESIRTISTDLGLNKSTISTTFRKHGYAFNKETKQFDLIPPSNCTKTVTTVDHKPVFSIPTKTKTKTTTKAFNVVMKEILVNQLDILAKSKNYSRNEIINIMCEYCLKNMN